MDRKPKQPDFDADGLGEEDRLLVNLYVQIGVALDALAYTDQFEKLYEIFLKQFEGWSQAEVYRRLINLRKSGQLPRIVRPKEAG